MTRYMTKRKQPREQPVLTPKAREAAEFIDGGIFGVVESEIVLGIDASLTNYALVAYDPFTNTHAAWLYQPTYKGPRRLLEIRNWVDAILESLDVHHRVVEVCLEGYSYGSVSQAHKIGEGGGATKLALVEHFGTERKVAYPTIVPPNTLKKFVAGSGKAKKNEMILRVYKKWGVELGADDNLADAYGLSRVAAALRSGETEYEYEQDVVETLRTKRNTEWEPPSP